MKNSIIKIVSLLIALMLVIAIVAIPVMGLTIPDPNYNAAGTDGIQKAGQNVAGMAAVLGVAVAVAVLIWLAIKYITAAPSDKADIKKSAVAYVIGAVLLFAASGVLAVIQNFAIDLNSDLKGGSIIRKA